MRKQFLAAALALGVSFFGGWGRAQAEYYEMYNPQTGVAGSATIYDTTCGTILELFVHTVERNEDVYRGETRAVGVVYSQLAGERYIRNLQAHMEKCIASSCITFSCGKAASCKNTLATVQGISVSPCTKASCRLLMLYVPAKDGHGFSTFSGSPAIHVP